MQFNKAWAYGKKNSIRRFFKKKTNLSFNCATCLIKINDDEEYIMIKSTKALLHIKCYEKLKKQIPENQVIKIKTNYLFNNCLKHFRQFSFYCQECQISICCGCDIAYHIENQKHHLKSIFELRETQKDMEALKSTINKQKLLLNKIKEMNERLIKSFKNDIEIKEKILNNYENNVYNYQSIQNFKNFELKNDKIYENILDDIIDAQEKSNNKISEEAIINTILSPLYYLMMINDNKNYNEKILNNFIEKIKNKYKDKEKSKSKFLNIDDFFDNKINNIDNSINSNINSNINNNINNKLNKYINNKEIISEKDEFIELIDDQKESKQNEKEDDDKQIIPCNNQEIKNEKQEKSIYNMILLSSGNIATSSMYKVTIYDKNKFLSPNEKDYILQIIYISKSKKVSYVFEFPDKSLFCSIYSKIFHLKLIENDTKYNILGIINLEKLELPTKLISLSNSLLVVLSIIKGESFIRLFMKANESNNKDYLSQMNNNNNDNNDINNNDNEKYNSDDQSAGILNDYINYLDKQKIEKDKEFYPYLSQNNNINFKELLLCSIQEIKMKNYNEFKNEYKYDFIVTSNSTWDYGKDIIIYYSLKISINKGLDHKTKVIKNISCSTEADSICQLNKQFICVGLQNHGKEGQINGFAIFDIKTRDVRRIIKDLAIYSLYYNFEKKLLLTATDIVEKSKKHKFYINIKEVVEGIGEIYLKNVYSFDSNHKDIIVSLLEISNNEKNEFESNESMNTIIVSASIDCNLKLIKLNKIDDK